MVVAAPVDVIVARMVCVSGSKSIVVTYIALCKITIITTTRKLILSANFSLIKSDKRTPGYIRLNKIKNAKVDDQADIIFMISVVMAGSPNAMLTPVKENNPRKMIQLNNTKLSIGLLRTTFTPLRINLSLATLNANGHTKDVFARLAIAAAAQHPACPGLV